MFIPVCKITGLHKYFEEPIEGALSAKPGAFQGMALHPTLYCTEMLKTHSLYFRQLPGGGAIYFNKTTGQTLKDIVDDSFTLSFFIQITDPNFYSYTDIKSGRNTLNPGSSIYYVQKRTSGMTTHPLAQLPIEKSRFTYSLDNTVTSALFEVKEDAAALPAWQLQLEQNKSVNAVTIDLQNQPEGRYQLLCDGKKVYDFYLTNKLGNKIWGVVDVFFSAAQSSQHINKAITVPVDISREQIEFIVFDNRSTIWEYILDVGASHMADISSYEVVFRQKWEDKTGPAQLIPFEQEEGLEGKAAGKKTFKYRSTVPIPLLARPSQQYDVKFRPKKGIAGPSFDLPYASGNAIRFMPGDPTKAMSEIFVYL